MCEHLFDSITGTLKKGKQNTQQKEKLTNFTRNWLFISWTIYFMIKSSISGKFYTLFPQIILFISVVFNQYDCYSQYYIDLFYFYEAFTSLQ